MNTETSFGRKLEDGREWRLPSLFYAEDLILCGESEEDVKVMVGWFAEVFRRKGLKINAGKSKVMVLNGEEGLECEVYINGIRLEHVSEFKYFGCFWVNQVQTGQNVVGRWQVGGELQVPLGPKLILWICSLSVLESCIRHCLYLFLCMAVRQCYGRRRRDLGLGLYR